MFILQNMLEYGMILVTKMILDLDIWLDRIFTSLHSHKYPNFIQVGKFMKIQSPIDNQEHIVKIQLQVTDIYVWSREWFVFEFGLWVEQIPLATKRHHDILSQ